MQGHTGSRSYLKNRTARRLYIPPNVNISHRHGRAAGQPRSSGSMALSGTAPPLVFGDRAYRTSPDPMATLALNSRVGAVDGAFWSDGVGRPRSRAITERFGGRSGE